MAVKVKPWVWVIVAIFAIGVLCVVAVAGAGFYFFSQHFDRHVTTPAGADSEFQRIRTQFTGQKPLIELDEHGRFLRSNPERPPRADRQIPANIYVLAFDPDDGRLVKVSIPFWLLRLKSRHAGGTIDFNGGRVELDDLKLTVQDLERFGPTLIVDHKATSGDRVLVWSQ
jgi:hypothetical protein